MIDKRLDWNSFHPFNSLETPINVIILITFISWKFLIIIGSSSSQRADQSLGDLIRYRGAVLFQILLRSNLFHFPPDKSRSTAKD